MHPDNHHSANGLWLYKGYQVPGYHARLRSFLLWTDFLHSSDTMCHWQQWHQRSGFCHCRYFDKNTPATLSQTLPYHLY